MMKKKKKIEETWNCGDCNAVLPISTEWCDAPQHEWAEQVVKLKWLVKKLSEERNDEERDKNYLTAEEFVENLMPPMKEYMIKMYGNEQCHPHDLATAAASFMDAYWIISEHRPL